MWKQLFFRTALLGLMLVMPAVAPAADDPAGKPALIMSLASYDKLRSDFFYLARLAAQDEYADLVEKMIVAQVGEKGLEGIDRKKRAGAYGWVGPHGDDSAFVLLVPVGDQTAFLSLLDRFDITARLGGDGIYSANVAQIPDPVYFRFANGYAYLTTRDKGVLADGRLLAPGEVLAGQGCTAPAGTDQKSGPIDYWGKGSPVDPSCRNAETSVFSMTSYLDRIPEEFKDQIVEEFELQLAMAKIRDAPAFETEWQKRFRLLTIDETARAIKTLIREGSEASMRLDLDRTAGDMALTYSVEGKPGSTMAAAIQELGQILSPTAGLLRTDAAVSGEVNVSLPEKLREMFGVAIEDGKQQALAKSKDQTERTALNTMFDAIMPTLRAAELDWTVSMQGPGSDGLYTVVGGVKLKDGARLERALRETAPRDSGAEVTFDVDRVGAVGIHRVTMDLEEDARRVFGDGPLFFAFRDDALLVAAGADGLAALKDAVAATPAMGKVMELQISVSRLAPLAKNREAWDIARRVFGGDRDGDRIRLTLEGGKAMTMRLAVKTKLVEYVGRIAQAMNALR